MSTEQPIDAKALSIIVPVRIDGSDRAENLRTITAYIRRFFTGCELILVEVDASSKVDQLIKDAYDRVVLVETAGRFSRSGAMNRGLLESSRRIVAFYDADVLVHPSAAADAIRLIINGDFALVLPFNGLFLDIKGEKRARIVETLITGDLAARKASSFNDDPLVEVRHVDGGVLFADRQVMLGAGGFNANMISYGWEDVEILRRFETLGYYSSYVPHNLIHLDHSRGADSVKNEHYDNNRAEYERVAAMDRVELTTYTANQLCPRSGLSSCAEHERAGRRYRRNPISVIHARSFASKVRSRLARRA